MAPVTSVAVSADGKTLVGASLDRAVRFWDAGTGRLKLTLIADAGQILAVGAGATVGLQQGRERAGGRRPDGQGAGNAVPQGVRGQIRVPQRAGGGEVIDAGKRIVLGSYSPLPRFGGRPGCGGRVGGEGGKGSPDQVPRIPSPRVPTPHPNPPRHHLSPRAGGGGVGAAVLVLLLAGSLTAADPWHLAGWNARAVVEVAKPAADRAAIALRRQGPVPRAAASPTAPTSASSTPPASAFRFSSPSTTPPATRSSRSRAYDPKAKYFVYFDNPNRPRGRRAGRRRDKPGAGPPKGAWVPKFGLVYQTRVRPRARDIKDETNPRPWRRRQAHGRQPARSSAPASSRGSPTGTTRSGPATTTSASTAAGSTSPRPARTSSAPRRTRRRSRSSTARTWSTGRAGTPPSAGPAGRRTRPSSSPPARTTSSTTTRR